ncbi:hypothetical protein [Escherichia coli]|uniref:hypothetical protein n=1 Tax=Escherichia coli TaxID=562 RepID=UPI0039657727
MITDNYFFRVPATRGIQGGIEQYMLTVPMVVLRRILAMDNDGDVMDRSQREANKTRAKKYGIMLPAQHQNEPPIFCRQLPEILIVMLNSFPANSRRQWEFLKFRWTLI